MTTRSVIRAGGVLALGAAAVCLPAALAAQHRGGGGNRSGGGGQRGGGAPPATVGTPAAPAASGRAHVGIYVGGRSRPAPSPWLNPAPGFGGTLGQGVGYNLGQGLIIPPRASHPQGDYAGGRWRRHDRFGQSAVVVVPYASPYVYTTSYAYPVYVPVMPDEAAAPEPVYYAPAGYLRRPPPSMAPSAVEGIPMGRYPIVIRSRSAAPDTSPRLPADSSGVVRAAAAYAAPAADSVTRGAAGGFVVEELADNVMRLRWPDDGRGVREVTLFLAGRNGQVMASQTVAAAPFSALFDATSRPLYVGVTVVRPDGTKVTTSVPYQAR